MWETFNCGKRVISQYLPCIDKSQLNLNFQENMGNIGLQIGQYDITGIMQVNKTNGSSLLIVCCHSGELMILKINGRNRTIDLIHLINILAPNVQPPVASKQTKSLSDISKQNKKLNLFGLSKLGDGRFIVMSNKGFSIW